MGKSGWGRTGGHVCTMLAIMAVFFAMPAFAVDFDLTSDDLAKWGDIHFSWTNRISGGAAMRVEDRDNRIVGKQNVSGNQLLCTYAGSYHGGDCQSLNGDPEPSRRLIAAPGGYNINGDDGNLNYDKGDVTYSGVSLRSTLGGEWRNVSFKVGGIGYYDPVNSNFKTHLRDMDYPNRGTQANQTITLNRDNHRRSDLEDESGWNAKLLEAYVSTAFKVADDHQLRLAVGQQYLRWGESTFMLFNNLAQINPLSATLWRLPGAEVKDAFLPTNLATAGIDLAPKLSLSGFYQLTWKRTEPDISGTYMSVQDVAGAGHGPVPIYLGFDQYPEDPLGQLLPEGFANTIARSDRTVYLDHDREPSNGGQFGFRLDYYADWLNGGTEMSLYGMNIHSRLPYFSAEAAMKGCYDIGAFYPDPYSGGSVFGPCLTMYGLDENNPDDAKKIYADYAVPVGSIRPFLEYPEDIHIFGASFNTTVGDWSLAGELTYSPNQPAQVSVVDVVYAAEQPAFPDTPAGNGMGGVPNNYGISRMNVPTNRVYIPDYIETVYRRGNGLYDTDVQNRVQPGDYIRGYERLKVGQISFTGIRIFSGSNWIRANQILAVGEVAAVRVFDMPSISRVQFEGATGRNLHYSMGQSEYDPVRDGVPGPVEYDDDGYPIIQTPANGGRIVGPLDVANPERASRKSFATDFAWGYRARVTATYNDVIGGVGFTPGIEIWHDVKGTSIYPAQDFVEGRIQTTFSNEFKFTESTTALLRYVMFSGGGYRNTRIDRDYIELSFTNTF